MLHFAPLPFDTQGQPLLPDIDAFPDHLDNHLLYYLPSTVTLLNDGTGTPDFFLLRYHGDNTQTEGGLLRFRLGTSPLPAVLLESLRRKDWQVGEVGFSAARFRLRLRSWQAGAEDETGEWRLINPAGQELVAPALSLTAHETQFLELLLADGQNAVELQLELAYAGLTPGLPWLASCDGALLRTLLAALLPGAEPVSAEQIVAAFLSLPSMAEGTLIVWQPMEPGATRPSDEVLLREIALRSLDRLFERQPADDPFEPTLYRLRSFIPGDPLALAWDLLPPRQESRIHRLSWSVSSLLQSLESVEAIKRFFPTVAQVSPFAKVDIHLINRLPFDPHFLRKVAVDLRYSGASGVPEYRSFTFDGSTEIQHFSVFYPAVVGDFQLAARFTTTQSPPSGVGWPIVRRGEYVPINGVLVEINRANVGMEFVNLESESVVYARASSILVELYDVDPNQDSIEEVSITPLHQLTLHAERPNAALAMTDVDATTALFVRALAYPIGAPDLPPYPLYVGCLNNRHLRIAAYQLEVLDPDLITIRLEPSVAAHFAWIRITFAAPNQTERAYILQPNQPIVWNFFRNSVFDPIAYRYRLDTIALDEQGHTLPMHSSDWISCQDRMLLVSP